MIVRVPVPYFGRWGASRVVYYDTSLGDDYWALPWPKVVSDVGIPKRYL